MRNMMEGNSVARQTVSRYGDAVSRYGDADSNQGLLTGIYSMIF